MDLTAGKALHNGKYLIHQVLSQGPVGLILQGTLTQSQRPVILKTLKPQLQASPQFSQLKQRFNERMNCLAGSQHPGLERMIDTFEEAGLPFAVMDYTVGQTLAELVKTNGPLSEELAIRYVQQVGSALATLHQHDLIHRCVTPANVICPPGSTVSVLVNVALEEDILASVKPGDKATPSAREYAAIEQYQLQHPLTPATDLYSLAGTLYFLLTGRAPLAAPLRRQAALVAPRQFRPELSTTVETAIFQGLELNPNKRPAIATWLSLLSGAGTAPVVAAANLPASNQQVKPSTAHAPVLNGKTATPSAPSSPNATSPTVQPKQPILPMLSLSPSKRFSKALLTTIVAAAAIGVGSGLALRFAVTSTGPGASFFHSEQSFPALENWPGEVVPTNPPSVYIPPAESATPQETRRFESADPVPAVRPRPAEPVTPPPTDATSEPAPVPSPGEPVIPAPAPAPSAIAPEPVAPPPINPPVTEPEPLPPPQSAPPSPVQN
ncbi:MAG: protein kinase [Oscillatoriales cyanobacterium C42_A2020_001]|nr:protein kinase [Leptolyngbyaceae cyanobacterium C42_A2020_001]